MKRFVALVLALVLCSGCICVRCFYSAIAEEGTSAEEEEVSEENETAGIGYIDPYQEFYVVVPVYWAAIGCGSTEQNMIDARRILSGSDVDADDLYETLLERKAPMFIALGEGAKSGVVITYGKNEYVSNASMLDDIDSIRQSLKSMLGSSIRFIEADCGSYSFRSVENILRLHMLSGTDDVDQ